MKRTLSGEILKIDDQESQDNSDSQQYSYDQDVENSFTSSQTEEQEYPCDDCFTPNEIDKQIVRLSLGMICGANMYDWDLANSYDTYVMRLKDTKIICIDEECFDCDILNHIEYDKDITDCTITCKNKKTGKVDIIYLSWCSNRNDNILSISKDFFESSYILFKTKVRRGSVIITDDRPELSWCYFPDARYHLDRIRPE